MSIAHSVGVSARPRSAVPDKSKRPSLLKSPVAVGMLMAQVIVTIWYFRDSVQSLTDLSRAVLMGGVPLVAVWTAMGVLCSMRKTHD